jgi:hypothetical protein
MLVKTKERDGSEATTGGDVGGITYCGGVSSSHKRRKVGRSCHGDLVI